MQCLWSFLAEDQNVAVELPQQIKTERPSPAQSPASERLKQGSIAGESRCPHPEHEAAMTGLNATPYRAVDPIGLLTCCPSLFPSICSCGSAPLANSLLVVFWPLLIAAHDRQHSWTAHTPQLHPSAHYQVRPTIFAPWDP